MSYCMSSFDPFYTCGTIFQFALYFPGIVQLLCEVCFSMSPINLP